MAQHRGRREAHLSENKGVKSECKKCGENLRQLASVSTICDEDCILQNSPYFCVFKYARAVKQQVWNEAENRDNESPTGG